MTDSIPSTHRANPGTSPWVVVALAVGLGFLAWLFVWSFAHGEGPHQTRLPGWWGVGVTPFAGLLGCIAVLPLIPATHRWWENNLNRLLVSMAFACATVMFFSLSEGLASLPPMLSHAIVLEYIPFIVLLFALYVISGGIHVRGDLPAHPLTNTAFLLVGALIASVVGTTGASMLLIRPLLQSNSQRTRVTHTIIFFIFLVSNAGGCLLPIGDPPLFLGYLRQVPFTWTLGLWKEWAFCCGILLVLYFVWDSMVYRREPASARRRDDAIHQPLRLRGWINFIWLALTIIAVALLDTHKALPGTDWKPFPLLREVVMFGLVGLSLLTTPRGLRQESKFNYAAIAEVAALFIGIFITMQVPIAVLNALGSDTGLEHPWQFFWASGLLSSVLDNAPTYVVFFETADAMQQTGGPGVLVLNNGQFIREDLLAAVSLGAVFMGANTYIGNGPNFMVKSIAEQAGVQMPTFFGYVFKYTLPILIPVFVLITLLFLR